MTTVHQIPSDAGTLEERGIIIGYRLAKKSGRIVRCEHMGCALDRREDGSRCCGSCGQVGTTAQFGHSDVANAKAGPGYYRAVGQ